MAPFFAQLSWTRVQSTPSLESGFTLRDCACLTVSKCGCSTCCPNTPSPHLAGTSPRRAQAASPPASSAGSWVSTGSTWPRPLIPTSPATPASTTFSPVLSSLVRVRWLPPIWCARWTARSASLAASSATRFSRPRATPFRPPRWWVATRRWARCSRTATLPTSTSAPRTTTASTCPATDG